MPQIYDKMQILFFAFISDYSNVRSLLLWELIYFKQFFY